MDADSPSTGSPILDLFASRRRAQEVAEDQAEPPVVVEAFEPGPEPASNPEPQLPEGPLAAAARLRRQRAAASVEAGVVVDANGAPGRLHALHRRKTRGTPPGG